MACRVPNGGGQSDRTRRWYESMARSGRACVCPYCGGMTLAKCGFHARCAKAAGVRREGNWHGRGRATRGGE